MPQLVSQFELRTGIARTTFDAAWRAFAAHLLSSGLAAEVGPVQNRRASSGFDTDAMREQSIMTVIRFADQTQADTAWAAIEECREPLAGFHQDVIQLVHDPVFTFWDDD
jgi:hypothetical protein